MSNATLDFLRIGAAGWRLVLGPIPSKATFHLRWTRIRLLSLRLFPTFGRPSARLIRLRGGLHLGRRRFVVAVAHSPAGHGTIARSRHHVPPRPRDGGASPDVRHRRGALWWLILSDRGPLRTFRPGRGRPTVRPGGFAMSSGRPDTALIVIDAQESFRHRPYWRPARCRAFWPACRR